MESLNWQQLRSVARTKSAQIARERGGFFPGHSTLVAAEVIRHLEDAHYQVGGVNGDVSLAEIRAAVESCDTGVDPLRESRRYVQRKKFVIHPPARELAR